jgi:hypothetical protein
MAESRYLRAKYDKEYCDLIRSVIVREDDLTNQRLTWMATLNGLMFTGLVFVWGKPYHFEVILAFCILGMVIC